jgi:hypothetical protein
MIGFKDMTFCPYWKSCLDGNTCKRALTDKVQGAADEWWTGMSPDHKEGEAPICMFFGEPECYRDTEEP